MRIDGRCETGATLVELVGLTGAVLALMLMCTGPLSARGGAIGTTMAGRLRSAITGARESTARYPYRRSRTVSLVRERRASGGGDPQRVPRDDIRLSPAI